MQRTRTQTSAHRATHTHQNTHTSQVLLTPTHTHPRARGQRVPPKWGHVLAKEPQLTSATASNKNRTAGAIGCCRLLHTGVVKTNARWRSITRAASSDRSVGCLPVKVRPEALLRLLSATPPNKALLAAICTQCALVKVAHSPAGNKPPTNTHTRAPSIKRTRWRVMRACTWCWGRSSGTAEWLLIK